METPAPCPAISPAASARAAPWWRLALALLLGAALWLAGTVASQFIPEVLLGLPLEGTTFALVGLLQIALVTGGIALALRICGLRLRDIGPTAAHWRADALIGAAVAIAWAALQFLVIIPATGGAERSDVAANAAQLGQSAWSIPAFVVLAWTGGFAEELFFRGHLLTLAPRLLGGGLAGTVLAAAGVIALFAALHAYQGIAGVLDTAFYGGLTLTLLFLGRGGRLTAPVVAHALWNSLAAAGIYAWY